MGVLTLVFVFSETKRHQEEYDQLPPYENVSEGSRAEEEGWATRLEHARPYRCEISFYAYLMALSRDRACVRIKWSLRFNWFNRGKEKHLRTLRELTSIPSFVYIKVLLLPNLLTCIDS